MKKMSKEQRKKAIEHNKKIYDFIDKDSTSINGGIKVESLPTLDMQEGTINYDDIDNFDII